MSSFRTEIFPEKPAFQFNYKSNILLLGSCFAQNIGEKMHSLGFNILNNPFGVLYNPLSVFKVTDMLLSEKEYIKDNLSFHNKVWFSFDHHSSFSDISDKKCLDKINLALNRSRSKIPLLDIVIITFGTSWAYKLRSTDQIVANCHKVPASEFERFFIESIKVEESIKGIVKRLRDRNKNIKFIFTVSPVRHWKDGAAGNMLSKSNLIVAIHNSIKKLENAFYFPSFEIMMDDLRDYRFYNEDMIHPSSLAVDYIWNKFKESYVDKEIFDLMDRIEKLNLASMHKPFNPLSDDYRLFIGNNIKKVIEIQKKYNLNLSELVRKFEMLIS